MGNVIITGATGFIGRNLTKFFLEKNYDVYAVVRNPNKAADFNAYENFHIIRSDLAGLTEEMFPVCDYDCFFHFAWAGVNRDEIDSDSIHEANKRDSIHCLELAVKLNCAAFCDSGSKAEYGNLEGKHEETAPCKPENAYGRKKLEFYRFAYDFTRDQKIRYVHLRFFAVIGKGDHPWSLISSACNCLVSGENMQCGACDRLWNFTSIKDVVEAVYCLFIHFDKIEKTDNAIFNICGYDTRILRSFIVEIYTAIESRSEYSFDLERLQKDYMDPTNEKLVTLTGWKPKDTFIQTVREIIEA